MATILQYVPFSSLVEPGFWHKLTENKLNLYGLDDKPRQLKGSYFTGDPAGLAPRLTVDYTAFDVTGKVNPQNFLAGGVLHNMNTVEAFKDCDKKQLITALGTEIWNDIKSGEALKNPALLSKFLLLTYADLKKYNFYYWFASPCLVAPETVHLTCPPVTLYEKFNAQQINSLLVSYYHFQQERVQYDNYFVLVVEGEHVTVQHVSTITQALASKKQVLAGFCDPSTLETNPGWPLRNFLALLAFHCGTTKLQVVCLRDRVRNGEREVAHSLVLSVQLTSIAHLTETPKVLGWERNERNKMGARMINLSSTMDPERLAESAVDLNLKLMRWRLLPDLNLEKISATKCLLLGAGTLGCNVARNLLSWGIHHVTFLDNARVSYSNPVRQSLFTFEDCQNGGRPKAEAAADALKRIFPGVVSEGIKLSIPMPGHSVSEGLKQQVQSDVQKLEELIEQHDAIFLLMDSRESRWLPTVIAGAKRKIVINAALGFETFLVQRHGVRGGQTSTATAPSVDKLSPLQAIPGSQLSCYFCNDMVAPGNSMRDRTLDQQCTVTRPGVSLMAGALAVELLVSIVQHPMGCDAPSYIMFKEDAVTDDAECCLGLVPHQIRGYLSRFNQVVLAGHCFPSCVACSPVVLDQYKEKGFQFLLQAFNDPLFLEDLTGLKTMQEDPMLSEVWDLDDEDDEASMETL